MTDLNDQWMIGADGLSHSEDGISWTRLGSLESSLTGIIREPDRIVAAAGFGSGLWEWTTGAERWKQLHDETLTEVLAIAPTSGNPGLIAGSPYGISTASRDEVGAARWQHHSDDLRVNERYTNAILVDPYETDSWLIGTEAGLLIATEGGAAWERTSLSEVPVRALHYALDTYWAGTDGNGIWRSSDGQRWDRAGNNEEDASIYDLAVSDGRILAGSGTGVLSGDGTGRWQRTGPRMLTAAIGAHPGDPADWLAGSAPGGLWRTDDHGITWRQIDGFKGVLSILAPGGTQA
jgi:hypothetical protein